LYPAAEFKWILSFSEQSVKGYLALVGKLSLIAKLGAFAFRESHRQGATAGAFTQLM
jgi:hypothetical protein